jgi:hypothetical protein
MVGRGPTPVWFAPDGYTTFVWVSRPDARHSRNLAGRPNVGIVILTRPSRSAAGRPSTSKRSPNRSRRRSRAGDRDVLAQVEVARRRPLRVADVIGSASHRLYRAEASAHYLLVRNDARIPVDPNAT